MLTTEINFDFARAARLLLPSTETITIALVGCGGTGSWLAPSVVRVARLLIEKYQKVMRVFFIDPDGVEAKNVYRQNFCEAEIGRNKADALAFRYGTAWGVEVSAISDAFNARQVESSWLNVIIGCVDNAPARKEIRKSVSGKARSWWLDCGNHRSAGQVVLGSGAKQPADPFELPGFCSWLPIPTTLHPELLETIQDTYASLDENLSCADMAMQDSQGLAINQRIAAEAADYLVRMLLTKDLRKYATYIDLASGTTKSKYIIQDKSPENNLDALERRVADLVRNE